MPTVSQFVARIYNRYFKMADVAALTFTALTPWARFNPATGKMEGAALPSTPVPLTLTAPGPTVTPLTLIGAAGQATPLIVIKTSDGSSAFRIESDGQFATLPLFTSAYVLTAQSVNQAQYKSALTPLGFELALDAALSWTNASAFYQGDTKTTLTRQSDGLIKVEKVAADGTKTPGGMLQKGVYVPAANAPAASTPGAIIKKIAAYDADKNLLGYIAVYDSIN